MDATGAGLPVAAVRTHRRLDLLVLARLVGSIQTLAAVIGLSTVGFSTASRAETVPAVTETSVPQLRVHPPELSGPVWSVSTVFNSMAAVQAAYPPGETNVWTYQLSNWGDSDKAFFTDVHPLPGCGNCYTEPLGYPWTGQFRQISPYCRYGNGDLVSPIGYTMAGANGDPICPSRLACPPPPPPSTTPYTLIGEGLCWRPDECPVAALTPIPFTDNCATTLERYNSTQAEKDAACGTLTPAMQTAVACFQNKLTGVNNPATGQPIPLVVTAGVRNVEYQRHLREIWDKMERIVRETRNNPALQTACAARRAELAAEKGCDHAGGCRPRPPYNDCQIAGGRNHCIVSAPARPNPNDATHTQGNAIDVDETQTVNPLETALSLHTPPQTIQGWLDAPTNCNLNWLGDADRVHFQLRQ